LALTLWKNLRRGWRRLRKLVRWVARCVLRLPPLPRGSAFFGTVHYLIRITPQQPPHRTVAVVSFLPIAQPARARYQHLCMQPNSGSDGDRGGKGGGGGEIDGGERSRGFAVEFHFFFRVQTSKWKVLLHRPTCVTPLVACPLLLFPRSPCAC
jgi:hypothetical protein